MAARLTRGARLFGSTDILQMPQTRATSENWMVTHNLSATWLSLVLTRWLLVILMSAFLAVAGADLA